MMWNGFNWVAVQLYFFRRIRFYAVAMMFLWLGLIGVAPAQTMVSPLPSSLEICHGDECVENPARAEAPESVMQTRPYRSWQTDDPSMLADHRAQGPRKDSPDARERRQSQPRNKIFDEREEESEFQKFVQRSLGTSLPIYGRSFFRHALNSYGATDRIPAPADYTLKAGDHLLIHMWGKVDFNARVIVDRNGQIFIPKIGLVSVQGVRYAELHEYLRPFFARLYRNFELSVSLGQLNSIQVLVVGRARRPGRYTVSSLTSLANFLFIVGGPAPNGSLRRIQLIRQNKVQSEFDFYDLLLKGNRSHDEPLFAGDVVYIPPVGPQVALAGSLNQPAIYELRDTASVQEAIALAGGLSATASGSRAVLERIEAHIDRKVDEFPLEPNGLARLLRDGDVLQIFPVSPRFENAVTLRGNVAQPGRYAWHPGMRLQDLIPSREAVIPNEYWTRQNAQGRMPKAWIDENEMRRTPRKNRENGLIRDSAAAPKEKDGKEQSLEKQNDEWEDRTVPGETPSDDLRTQEPFRPPDESVRQTKIERNPAEVNWDYAVVERLNQSDLSSRLLSFNLGRAINDARGADNIALEPGDTVTIFSQQDLQVPVEKRSKFVWIEGEVKASGVYRAEPGETLREIVARAGGLTAQAYLFACDFRRESTRKEQQQKLQRMVEDTDKELRSRAKVLTVNTNAEERQRGREELDAERGLIEKLKQTRPTGRIVLELKPTDMSADLLPPLPLEDGDRLFIPPKSATIEVVGSVYNQSSFIYQPDKSVADYLRRSGGSTRDGDTSRLFVIRADGSVVSKQMHRSLWAGKFESLRLMPGDTIIMPERIRTTSFLRGIRDWSQVFSQFALGAAALKVLSP